MEIIVQEQKDHTTHAQSHTMSQQPGYSVKYQTEPGSGRKESGT